eukprot:3950560-Lingulodinium_polyedra.AAC.1
MDSSAEAYRCDTAVDAGRGAHKIQVARFKRPAAAMSGSDFVLRHRFSGEKEVYILHQGKYLCRCTLKNHAAYESIMQQ